MLIDKKEHKALLEMMMNQVNFPGAVLEVAAELKQSILNANVMEPKNVKEKSKDG